jgi:hypothetical protein
MKIQTRFYLAGLAVLVAGVAAALLIYFGADEDAARAALDEMVSSKRYVRTLQQFGGKASVLFDEFSRWFDGLWHGRALASTVLWLSIAASGLLFLVASRLNDRD